MSSSAPLESEAYLMTAGALVNVIKHADAHDFELSLRFGRDLAVLRYLSR